MATKVPPPPPPPPPSVEESAFVDAPTTSADRLAAIGEVAEGGSYRPTESAVSRGGVPATRLPGNPAFLLAFHPHRWTIMGGTVVPAFKRIKYLPGVNGCDQRIRQNGTIEAIVAPARAQAEERGEVIIPFHAIPRAHVGNVKLHQTPGAPPSYLWRPQGRPDVHLLIYERCYPGSDAIECDLPHYLEFCEALRTEHRLIPECPVFLLRQMLEKARKDAGIAMRDAAKFSDNKDLQSFHESLVRTVTVLEEELASRVAQEPSDGAAVVL